MERSLPWFLSTTTGVSWGPYKRNMPAACCCGSFRTTDGASPSAAEYNPSTLRFRPALSYKNSAGPPSRDIANSARTLPLASTSWILFALTTSWGRAAAALAGDTKAGPWVRWTRRNAPAIPPISPARMPARNVLVMIESFLASRGLHQTIADRRLGQNMLGLRGIILELVPQMAHVNAHVVAVFGVRGSPDFAQDLPVREYLAGVGDQ